MTISFSKLAIDAFRPEIFVTEATVVPIWNSDGKLSVTQCVNMKYLKSRILKHLFAAKKEFKILTANNLQ